MARAWRAAGWAPEALALHLQGLAEDGLPIPMPATLDALANDPARKRAVAIWVNADVQEKVQRFNITARRSQMKEIDRRARLLGMTRSAYVVSAALEARGVQARKRSRKV